MVALPSLSGQATTVAPSGNCVLKASDVGPAGNVLCNLCLPQIKPEHIGDAVHPGSAGTECAPLPRRHVISVRPCSTISECACHCTTRRRNAHGIAEHELLYPWHPWAGCLVHIHEVVEKVGRQVFRCSLSGRASGRWLEIPAWMFDRAARAAWRVGAAPDVEIAVLTALATLLQDVTSVSGAPSQLRDSPVVFGRFSRAFVTGQSDLSKNVSHCNPAQGCECQTRDHVRKRMAAVHRRCCNHRKIEQNGDPADISDWPKRKNEQKSKRGMPAREGNDSFCALRNLITKYSDAQPKENRKVQISCGRHDGWRIERGQMQIAPNTLRRHHSRNCDRNKSQKHKAQNKNAQSQPLSGDSQNDYNGRCLHGKTRICSRQNRVQKRRGVHDRQPRRR